MKSVSISVSYTDPKESIKDMLEEAGAKSVNVSNSYNGANFYFHLDDIVDEREFKRQIIETLRRNGFRAN